MSKSKEKVLVFPDYVFKQAGYFNGFKTNNIRDYLSFILNPENVFFMDRDAAEKDSCYKQIIPYTILMQGNEVFKYQRTKKGGENRLHDLWSIGVGGHINPGDNDGVDLYKSGFLRELQEEVGLALTEVPEPVGLLYDGSNSVGQVHFGIISIVKVILGTPLMFHDPALQNGQFVHKLDLKRSGDNYENWSRLVIENLF